MGAGTSLLVLSMLARRWREKRLPTARKRRLQDWPHRSTFESPLDERCRLHNTFRHTHASSSPYQLGSRPSKRFPIQSWFSLTRRGENTASTGLANRQL